MNPKRLKELRAVLMELREWTRLENGLEHDVPTRAVWTQVGEWAEGVAAQHNLTLERTAQERLERQRQIFP